MINFGKGGSEVCIPKANGAILPSKGFQETCTDCARFAQVMWEVEDCTLLGQLAAKGIKNSASIVAAAVVYKEEMNLFMLVGVV